MSDFYYIFGGSFMSPKAEIFLDQAVHQCNYLTHDLDTFQHLTLPLLAQFFPVQHIKLNHVPLDYEQGHHLSMSILFVIHVNPPYIPVTEFHTKIQTKAKSRPAAWYP